MKSQLIRVPNLQHVLCSFTLGSSHCASDFTFVKLRLCQSPLSPVCQISAETFVALMGKNYMERLTAARFNTERFRCFKHIFSRGTSLVLCRDAVSHLRFCYSIAGLYAQQLLRPVACGTYACSGNTLRVNYEHLGVAAAPMHNKIRSGAF